MRSNEVEHIDEYAETEVLLPGAQDGPTDPDVNPFSLYAEYESELARDPTPPPARKRG